MKILPRQDDTAPNMALLYNIYIAVCIFVQSGMKSRPGSL